MNFKISGKKFGSETKILRSEIRSENLSYIFYTEFEQTTVFSIFFLFLQYSNFLDYLQLKTSEYFHKHFFQTYFLHLFKKKFSQIINHPLNICFS